MTIGAGCRLVGAYQGKRVVGKTGVFEDDQYVFALLEAGAAGYLLKNVRGRDLVEAIRAVHAGESVLHPVIARKVIDRFSSTKNHKEPRDNAETVSDRELELLRFAARGMSNRDIACHLHLSVRTVQAHLHSIFGKMEAGSRTEAVVQALHLGWVTLDDTLYRIVQEALNNIKKHARASHVKTVVEFGDDSVRVSVQDDGQGFEMPARLSDLANLGRLGFVGMHERVQLLRGTLTVRSELGKGMTVIADVPA
jgi:DNA-binding CsgD family transcriptional regulator